jgi:DNA polymerase-3 subunit gamma/tau
MAEEFRPRTWGDVVGQDKAVARIRALAKRGLAGRAYWISGQSGTGKTTIGRLIAAEVADDDLIREVDAAGLTVSALRELESEMGIRGWGKGGRAYLVNEAHALRKDVIRQLLVMLERIPSHVVIVFTTTTEGQEALFEDFDDASPLLSRCLRIDLSRRDLCGPFADVIVRNCRAAGLLNGKPDSYYVARMDRFLKRNKNNCRAGYQAAESGYLTDSDESDDKAP